MALEDKVTIEIKDDPEWLDGVISAVVDLLIDVDAREKETGNVDEIGTVNDHVD